MPDTHANTTSEGLWDKFWHTCSSLKTLVTLFGASDCCKQLVPHCDGDIITCPGTGLLPATGQEKGCHKTCGLMLLLLFSLFCLTHSPHSGEATHSPHCPVQVTHAVRTSASFTSSPQKYHHRHHVTSVSDIIRYGWLPGLM
jgi:hypothetical protein